MTVEERVGAAHVAGAKDGVGVASLLGVVDGDGSFEGDDMGDFVDVKVLVVGHVEFDVLADTIQAGGDVAFQEELVGMTFWCAVDRLECLTRSQSSSTLRNTTKPRYEMVKVQRGGDRGAIVVV